MVFSPQWMVKWQDKLTNINPKPRPWTNTGTGQNQHWGGVAQEQSNFPGWLIHVQNVSVTPSHEAQRNTSWSSEWYWMLCDTLLRLCEYHPCPERNDWLAGTMRIHLRWGGKNPNKQVINQWYAHISSSLTQRFKITSPLPTNSSISPRNCCWWRAFTGLSFCQFRNSPQEYPSNSMAKLLCHCFCNSIHLLCEGGLLPWNWNKSPWHLTD